MPSSSSSSMTTWDLRCPAQPNSVCLLEKPPKGIASTASASLSTNPFDSAADEEEQQHVQAVLFGTERGSLHYRCFAPTSSGSSSLIQAPLGASSGSGGTPSDAFLPKQFLPFDVVNIVPGMVADVLSLGTSSSKEALLFLVLVDDRGGSSASATPTLASILFRLHATKPSTPRGGGGGSQRSASAGALTMSPIPQSLPRMACAATTTSKAIIYGAGKAIGAMTLVLDASGFSLQKKSIKAPMLPGNIRSGSSAMCILQKQSSSADDGDGDGGLAIVAVGSDFYAVPFRMNQEGDQDVSSMSLHQPSPSPIPLLSCSPSSQIHPVLCVDVTTAATTNRSQTKSSHDYMISSVFLASGRECAVVDLQQVVMSDWDVAVRGAPVASTTVAGRAASRSSATTSTADGAKKKSVVTTLASPIWSATYIQQEDGGGGYMALLTSDGICSLRPPSCLAVSLRQVEVGPRHPNDFFWITSQQPHHHHQRLSSSDPTLTSISHSGEGKVWICPPDSKQDLSDRLMRLSIDAFGSNGFPRSELAGAIQASFTSTSYAGPSASAAEQASAEKAKNLLQQYLLALLGLSADSSSSSSFGGTSWPMEEELTSAARVSATALLCLVISQLLPSSSAQLACKAAKVACQRVGVMFGGSVATVNAGSKSSRYMLPAAVQLCEAIAEQLLTVASFFGAQSAGGGASSASSTVSSSLGIGKSSMSLMEAAIWLLRSCGKHERAIEIVWGRKGGGGSNPNDPNSSNNLGWSQIKYESYTATHLSELWATSSVASDAGKVGAQEGGRLVLRSDATKRLLESNPGLGLSVFTAQHPQNEAQWMRMSRAAEDPLANPTMALQVVELLKGIKPMIPYDHHQLDSMSSSHDDEEINVDDPSKGGLVALPLETGRALAVTYLESAVGVSTGRPTILAADQEAMESLPADPAQEERAAVLHDELAYLLLEGVIAERSDVQSKDDDDSTLLGKLYRGKLRRFLQWPLAKMHAQKLLSSVPSSFRQEQALLLGRLGRHEDALRILYCDLRSLDLALAYCDVRYQQMQLHEDRMAGRDRTVYGKPSPSRSRKEECAYLPLVKVALESDPDSERGTKAAIQVLALRSGALDRAAALRLLPQSVPVSAVARPFLIPALVDSESEIRRLMVASALLRAKYRSLQDKLTQAQIQAQSHLQNVPQLRPLRLGDPLHSSKATKARPAASSVSSTFPEVMITKHFFPRHLVIQAKVVNSGAVDGRSLGDVSFFVAESSDEAIQSYLRVPIQTLPYGAAGSAWCVLSAAPQRMEMAVILTCELRYSVLAAAGFEGNGRTYVEELQDMEVQAAYFS